MIEIVFVLFLIILINLFDIIEISNTTTDSLWHLNLRGRICYEIDDLFVSGLAFVFGSSPHLSLSNQWVFLFYNTQK